MGARHVGDCDGHAAGEQAGESKVPARRCSREETPFTAGLRAPVRAKDHPARQEGGEAVLCSVFRAPRECEDYDYSGERVLSSARWSTRVAYSASGQKGHPTHGEIRGDTGRYGGDTGRYGEMFRF